MWPRRANHDKTPLNGEAAEQLAQQHLKSQQLEIVTTNYRTSRGEIDIIARDGSTLIFVEVRLRSNNVFGSAAESVNPRKQAKLITAAQSYLQKNQLTNNTQCRFDVVAISLNNQNHYQVEWLQDAFSA